MLSFDNLLETVLVKWHTVSATYNKYKTTQNSHMLLQNTIIRYSCLLLTLWQQFKYRISEHNITSITVNHGEFAENASGHKLE